MEPRVLWREFHPLRYSRKMTEQKKPTLERVGRGKLWQQHPGDHNYLDGPPLGCYHTFSRGEEESFSHDLSLETLALLGRWLVDKGGIHLGRRNNPPLGIV